MPASITCPVCLAPDLPCEVQDAPPFMKSPTEPVLYIDCPHCRKYWIDATRKEDEVVVAAKTLATLAPLSEAERAYLSTCIQRMRDHDAWLIADEETAPHFLGDWRWGQAALPRWGFADAELMVSGGGFDAANRLFFVTRPDGARHVLRLVKPGEDPAKIRTLMDWLARLSAAGVPTLTPVPGLDGALVQEAALEGATRRAVAFEWIEGTSWEQRPPEKAEPALARNFGRAVGMIHQVSATMDLPDWYSTRRYDDRCWTDYMTQLKREEHVEYTAEQLAGFDDLERRLLDAMAQIGETRETFGLVPADLAKHNTIVQGDTPYLVDMMSFGWGYFLADLEKAISMGVVPEDRETFLAGYREIRPLPPGYDEYYDLFAEAREVAVHWF